MSRRSLKRPHNNPLSTGNCDFQASEEENRDAETLPETTGRTLTHKPERPSYERKAKPACLRQTYVRISYLATECGQYFATRLCDSYPPM